MNINPEVDLLRIKANSFLDPKTKSSLGQFFTPSNIGQFMASLFHEIKGEVKLLEPGCGVGSLIAAFVNETIKRKNVKSIDVQAYDVEPIVEPYLKSTLKTCYEYSISNGISFHSKFILDDFIENASVAITNDLFNVSKSKFSHVIINPPYKKINNESAHRKALSSVGIETVNLYTGFVALAIKLLDKGGELVAIIPRSFCNGPYYHSFRKLLLKETSIEQIHVFESRNKAFSDDEVLQENVIIHCVKGKKQSSVKITSSPQADFEYDEHSNELIACDTTIRIVDFESIVKPNDKQQFIHIASSEAEQKIIDELSCFTSTLEDLNLEVSTGPVVDFRLYEHLRKKDVKNSVPLIYPVHLNGSLQWPKQSKKPNAILVNNETKPWLWENKGNFIITRRFSSKEEKRRIVATFYDAGTLNFPLIGFENKLNVFHSKKKGVEENFAKGLFTYLNCTLLDKYYRHFGGHTQVNASDLRSIHYPDKISLLRIGSKIRTFNLTQKQIDEIITDEIEIMKGKKSNNPLKASEKIEDALNLLKSFGMPRAQQNERSALTLLALLNLNPEKHWKDIEKPMMGVTPIMDWCKEFYGKEYAPNTRETFRRQTLHQFVDAGLVLYNPDDPNRSVNSPKACYQIVPEVFKLIMLFKTDEWEKNLKIYLPKQKTLAERYAKEREMKLIPVEVENDLKIFLSAGAHSELIRNIISEFRRIFTPKSKVVYVGDTGNKQGYLKKDILAKLNIHIDNHGKMPDVVLMDEDKDWIFLIESVTSHGPVNSKRHEELSKLFAPIKDKLVYVTAFPDRRTMSKYLGEISWETEVWTADAPTHLIHFNGDRFLGPHI